MKRIIIMVLCIGQVVTISAMREIDISRGSGEIRSNDGSVSHDHQNNPSLFLMREIQPLELSKIAFSKLKKPTFSRKSKENIDAWHTRLNAIKDEEVVELPTQKILAIKNEGESVSFIDRIHSRFGLRKKNLNQIENEVSNINKEINDLKMLLIREIEENKKAPNKNIMKKTSVIIKQIDRLLKNKKALIQEAYSITSKKAEKVMAVREKQEAIDEKKEKENKKKEREEEEKKKTPEQRKKELEEMRYREYKFDESRAKRKDIWWLYNGQSKLSNFGQL